MLDVVAAGESFTLPGCGSNATVTWRTLDANCFVNRLATSRCFESFCPQTSRRRVAFASESEQVASRTVQRTPRCFSSSLTSGVIIARGGKVTCAYPFRCEANRAQVTSGCSQCKVLVSVAVPSGTSAEASEELSSARIRRMTSRTMASICCGWSFTPIRLIVVPGMVSWSVGWCRYERCQVSGGHWSLVIGHETNLMRRACRRVTSRLSRRTGLG
jgi:hypothetical protein